MSKTTYRKERLTYIVYSNEGMASQNQDGLMIVSKLNVKRALILVAF